MSFIIAPLDPKTDWAEWLRLYAQLFDDEPVAELEREMTAVLAESDTMVLVAKRPSSGLAGFVEVGTRKYAEGCTTAPVAYLEAWFVDEDMRRQGVGRALVKAAEQWALNRGLTEIASDTEISNLRSLAAHLALGYTEVERQICFIKSLGKPVA